MRALILTQYYNPEPIPKPHQLAVALQAKGHSVSVITGFPNYPKGILYDGWKLRLRSTEKIDDVPVVRTYEYPYHGRNVIKRALNYLTFMLSAPFGLLSAPRFDVIYVWHPPLTIGIAAWIISWLRRVPVVYDVQDIWPDSVTMSGLMRPGLAVRFMAKLERFIYKHAKHLIVVTEGARKNLIAKGVPPEKVTAMPHWVDEGAFGCVPEEQRTKVRREFGWDDKFVVLFAGNIGIVQRLDAVVRAAERLPVSTKIVVAIAGDGSDQGRLEQIVAERGVHNRVQFLGRLPLDRMPGLMAAADVLLVHLKESPVAELVLPAKTLAYLAAGKPILMGMSGAAAELVEKAQAGVVVEPENDTQLATAMIKLQAMPAEQLAKFGAAGRAYLHANFRKAKLVDMHEDLLRQASESQR